MKIIHEVRRSWGSAARRGARALLLLAPLGMLAWAAPQGAQVVQGNVSITTSSNLTTITASNNSIISYTGFNILAAETVRFIQPGATARVFNEVNSPNPTVIAGQLLANGQVYIFNSSGIVFANGCLVNAGAIYAAAAKLSEQNFVNGVNYFSAASGPVVNNGTIKAQAVVLFGSTVLNTGTILAPKGFVVLAAGDDLYLCEDGSQVMVKLTGAAAAGQGGAANADGTAAQQVSASLGAGDMYSVLVHNTGTVQAQNITLQSSASGAVKVEGTLDASNSTPGATGGTVEVLGGEVDLVGANINASGAAGGGKVLIGGDLHGQSGTPTAQITTVDRNSTIKADAITAGDGGEVVIWSDLATFCYGQISARGGAQDGNGGLVETSGHYLDVAGARIDTSAPMGVTGTWLLDPYDITIEAVSTQNPASITSGNFTSNGDPSILSVSDLETALSTTNVVVQTGSGGSGQGDITVAAPVTWTTATTLTLNAINNVNVNAGITGGSLVLSAGNTVSIASAIGLTGSLSVTGNTTLSADVTTAGGQTYNGTVTLGANTILADTGTGVAFDSTVDGGFSLTVNGNATFGGAVGGNTQLSSLDVTGTTAMNAGTVTTSGDQSYSQLVTLAQDTTLSGGTLQSVSGTSLQVAGAGNSLTLTFGGTTVIDGNLITGVNNLTVGDSGITGSATQVLNDITTTGEQLYYDPATLTGNATLTGPSSSYVVFFSTVDGGYSLEVNGNAAFGGAVGSLTPLSSLDVTGTTALRCGTIATSGGQTYTGAATLYSDTTLTDSGPGVTFGSTVDSVTTTPQVPYALTVNGNAAFDGAVGSVDPLSSLDVTGTTAMGAGSVTTTDGQTYNGAVTLSANTLLTDTGPGVIFGGTVDSVTAAPQTPYLLVVEGNAAFDAAVGSIHPLSDLEVTGTTAMDAGTVTTVGGQIYVGAVTLSSDTILATGAGDAPDIIFESSINGAYALTLDAGVSGIISVAGAIGNENALTTLTIADSGSTTFGASVTAGTIVLLNTTGAITFEGDVTATSLTTTPEPYSIIFDGATNSVTNPVTFLNTGGVTNGEALYGILELATAIPNMEAQPVPWYAPTAYLDSSALTLDAVDFEALRNLGIWPRSLKPDEVAALLLDDQLFVNDRPMKGKPDPADYTVALNRLSDKETQILLAQYRDLFWKGGLDQTDAIRASFEQALADCRKSGTNFTPAIFAQYVLTQNGDARQFGAGIKSLLAGLGRLGLASRDFGAAKESLLNLVKPADLSTADFGRFIEGL